jgi:hypothetical protein
MGTMATVLYYAGAQLDSWIPWCAGAVALLLEHLAFAQGVAHGVMLVAEMTDDDRKKLQQELLKLEHDIRDQ